MGTWTQVRSERVVPGRDARRETRRERDVPRPVCRTLQIDIGRALPLVGGSVCVLTAAYEQKRSGILVKRVMQCADEPPCILVAVRSGHRLATLIRDSHGFALSALDPTQRLIMKRFQDEEADPFDMTETRTLATRAPVLVRCVAAIDCEVVRHFDLDADHEVYVGLVLAGMVGTQAAAGEGAQSHPLPGADAGLADVPEVLGSPVLLGTPGRDAADRLNLGIERHTRLAS